MVSFNLNGKAVSVDAEPDMPVLYALRNGRRICDLPLTPKRVRAVLA